MKIYIVMEDMGDGDVCLNYFKTLDEAYEYIHVNSEYTYYESNPRCIDTENMRWSTYE